MTNSYPNFQTSYIISPLMHGFLQLSGFLNVKIPTVEMNMIPNNMQLSHSTRFCNFSVVVNNRLKAYFSVVM